MLASGVYYMKLMKYCAICTLRWLKKKIRKLHSNFTHLPLLNSSPKQLLKKCSLRLMKSFFTAGIRTLKVKVTYCIKISFYVQTIASHHNIPWVFDVTHALIT